MRLASRVTGFVFALAVCGVARDAAACLDIGDPCLDFDTWTAVDVVHAAPIPTDGVLLLRVTGPSGAPPVVELIEIEVTLDGVVVAGALEEVGVDGVLAWRPAQVLVGSSTYVVSGTIHNIEFMPGLEFCGEEFVPFGFEFVTASGPMQPPGLPAPTVSEAVEMVAELQLEHMVCCDGAFPRREWIGCGGSKVLFDEGSCVPSSWNGRLAVTVAAPKGMPQDASMISSELRVGGELVAQQFVVDGGFELTTAMSMPFCSELSLRNVATGEVTPLPQQCHGDALADQLGSQVLTPESPALAVCTGAPYVCEVDELGDEWDPDRCSAWPDGGSSTGEPGGPTSGGPTSGGPTSGSEPTTGASTTEGTMTGTATSPGQDGLVEHGCACASGDAPWRDAWVGLLVLAGWRRRRR